MKKINWANILMDLIYLVLGVVFIVRPADLESKMCYILACVMGAIGLLYLVGHFFQRVDESGRREGYGFTIGILLIILAIFVVQKQQLIIALVPFLFGIMVMIRGLIIIQNLFFFRRMGVGLLIPLGTGLVTMALGLIVMLYPFEKMTVLFTIIGIGLLVGGIAGVIEDVLVVSAIRKHAQARERAHDKAEARKEALNDGDAPKIETAGAEQVTDTAPDAKAGQAGMDQPLE